MFYPLNNSCFQYVPYIYAITRVPTLKLCGNMYSTILHIYPSIYLLHLQFNNNNIIIIIIIDIKAFIRLLLAVMRFWLCLLYVNLLYIIDLPQTKTIVPQQTIIITKFYRLNRNKNRPLKLFIGF